MSRDFNRFVPDYSPRLSPRSAREREREIEDEFNNQREAFDLLALIDAEFRTDPTSVQCFDQRIVERVRFCVAKREKSKDRC